MDIIIAAQLTGGPSNLTFCLQLSWCQPSEMKSNKNEKEKEKPQTQNCAMLCHRGKLFLTPTLAQLCPEA